LKKLLLFLSLINLTYADQAVWSKDTNTSISDTQVQEILKPYKQKEFTNMSFVDDIKKVYKDTGYQRNMLILGLSLGTSGSTETISTDRDSTDYTYSGSNYKLVIGKDFSFWHEEYSQPFRVQFEYELTKLSSGVDFTSYSLAFKENFTYLPLYQTPDSNLFPFAALRLGTSRIEPVSTTYSGFTLGFDLGLTYQVREIEYSLSYEYTQHDFDYPVDGVRDLLQQNKFYLSFVYKFMYEGY